MAYHFVSSMLSLMRWWLDQGDRYSPEQMAEYANRLLIRPISQLGTRGPDRPRAPLLAAPTRTGA